MSQPAAQFGEGPLELREYLGILRSRKWTISVVTLLLLSASVLLSLRQTPLYDSEARLLVQPANLPGLGLSGFTNVQTESQLVSSNEVAEIAARRLGNDTPPTSLTGGLSVGVATNTEILVLKYSSTDPAAAQLINQAFAEGYLEYRRQQVLDSLLAASEAVDQQIQRLTKRLDVVTEQLQTITDPTESANLQTQSTTLASQLALLQQQLSQLTPPSNLQVGQIVQEATLPTRPSSPNYPQNALLGAFFGLALGIGLAFLRERLDDRLRGRSDLEVRLEAPVLAVIPRVAKWRKRADVVTISISEPKSAAAEAYRTLRTSVLFAAAQQKAKVLLITGPHPGEGKTSTVANLGIVLAQSGKRVIIVSTDLRKPRLHKFFGAANDRGVTTILSGVTGWRAAIQSTGVPSLRVVASGPTPGNPTELLGSEEMGELVADLQEISDFVLLDAPPLLGVADAITLLPFADATLFVTDSQRSSRMAINQAKQQLEQVNARILGAVLSNFDPSKTGGYYYRHYYSYEYEAKPEQNELEVKRLARKK
jgi:non-specific protein-tyrosine kinase